MTRSKRHFSVYFEQIVEKFKLRTDTSNESRRRATTVLSVRNTRKQIQLNTRDKNKTKQNETKTES